MKRDGENLRESLLRKTGKLEQIAGVQRFTYSEGNAKGIAACRVKNGSGLDFTVLEGRCLDIFELSYKGISFPFYYKNGLYAAEKIAIAKNEYLNYGSGGMMFTSGLLNSGPECEAEGLFHPLHGRMGAMSAEYVSTRADFVDDERYVIEVSGQMQESRLFAHQLLMKRSITTELYSNSFHVSDRIYNNSCRPSAISLLYHINFGYPFLDEGVHIELPQGTLTEARSEVSQDHYAKRLTMSAPIDDAIEHLYYHRIPSNEEACSKVSIINEALRLKVNISFAQAYLPYLVEWKSMGSVDYALGIMPSSSALRGRAEELQAGGLTEVPAFSSIETGFNFEIVEI